MNEDARWRVEADWRGAKAGHKRPSVLLRVHLEMGPISGLGHVARLLSGDFVWLAWENWSRD